MRPYALALFAVSWSCLIGGCLGKQVAKDGVSIRQALLTMYTDQVMDNLVRARCHLPFVQLEYSDLNVTDADAANLNGSTEQTIQTARDLIVVAASRMLTNVYRIGGDVHCERSMSFHANPITDQNDIYEAYLEFANNPELLVVSDHPPKGCVHIHRKCGKKHYWVPEEGSAQFLDLVMKTTFMRGPETVPPVPAAYPVKVVQVLKPTPVEKRDIMNATLKFDQPIPNGDATLVADLDDGRRVRIRLWSVNKDLEGKRVQLGEPTVILDAQWAPETDKITADNLVGCVGRIYSFDYPPEAPTPLPSLRRIANTTDQIRIDLRRQRR